MRSTGARGLSPKALSPSRSAGLPGAAARGPQAWGLWGVLNGEFHRFPLMERQFHFSGHLRRPLIGSNRFFLSPKSCFLVLFWRQKWTASRRFGEVFDHQNRGPNRNSAHRYRGPRLHELIELRHIFIQHADATRRGSLANGCGLVGAMNAVDR